MSKPRQPPPPAPRTKAEALARVAQLERQVRRLARQLASATGRADEAAREGGEAQRVLIASSPDDAQPVFDAIARHALRLCGGLTTLVVRYDGSLLHRIAHENLGPDRADRVRESFPRPPERTFPMGAAVLDRTVVNVPDLRADAQFTGMATTRAGLDHRG